MKLSVVVPVYNGGTDLRRCLQSLAESARKPDEILIVDDGSTDGAVACAAEFSAQVVRLKGSPRGPAFARNRGARKASGEILVFVDADVRVHTDTLGKFEGLFLGGFSAYLDLRYPGIAMQAVGLTFGTLFVMLMAYRSGLIPVTAKLRMGIIAATGGIALFYLLEIVLSFFGIQFVSINGGGFIGIAFSLFVVAIAALNLVLDFDFIERGVQAGAPKYMEWYGAFGIIVTLVWLYLEILRLLSKLNRRN